MPLNIDAVEEKFEKCPFKLDTYCQNFQRILETQIDKIANCHKCKLFTPKD
ncbi:MAG: hypothetical protein V1859_05720 [archaeon]